MWVLLILMVLSTKDRSTHFAGGAAAASPPPRITFTAAPGFQLSDKIPRKRSITSRGIFGSPGAAPTGAVNFFSPRRRRAAFPSRPSWRILPIFRRHDERNNGQLFRR